MSWQARLEEAFGEGAYIGPELLSVIGAEKDFGLTVANTFHGHAVFASAFQALFIQTLHAAERSSAGSPDTTWYRSILLSFTTAFRLVRSCEQLLLSGYPVVAYSLTRELKDRAVVLTAVASRLVTYERANAWERPTTSSEPFSREDFRKAVNRRKKAEREIVDAVMGKKSGLGEATIEDLRRWSEMFHAEVHGSRVSFAMEAESWLSGTGPLPIYPDPEKENAIGIYMNRFKEVGWMFVRLFPFLQSQQLEFGEAWAKKWEVLDTSFREAIENRSGGSQGPGAPFIEFIDSKFRYSPAETIYSE